MLVKTRAILLKTIKYAENSVIARFYTEEYGLESFIINNIRSKKAPINAAHLQPLNLLEADIYQRSNANLQRIKELRCQPQLQSVYTDMVKTSAIVFMQEVLGKVIVEKEKNTELFDFLFSEIWGIETIAKLPALYPAYWLVKLSQYLGFAPAIHTWQEGFLFLPVEGVFSDDNTEPLYFDAEIAQIIYLLSTANRENLGQIAVNGAQRRLLLEKLLLFYRVHIEEFNELKSHKILAEVLS